MDLPTFPCVQTTHATQAWFDWLFAPADLKFLAAVGQVNMKIEILRYNMKHMTNDRVLDEMIRRISRDFAYPGLTLVMLLPCSSRRSSRMNIEKR